MLKDIIEFLHHRKPILTCWKEKQRHDHEESELKWALEVVGLPQGIASELGTAIGFAREFKMELYHGLSYGDCRVVLSKTNWRYYDAGDPDEVFVWGQFLHKTRKEVTEIQRLDTDICFAIAYCALFAREAGVI